MIRKALFSLMRGFKRPTQSAPEVGIRRRLFCFHPAEA